MYIAARLRELREVKRLSQGDIEEKTGLLRCYVSRVENGHTIPSLATLEKFARALDVPTYQLFYDGEKPPAMSVLTKSAASDGISWGSTGRNAKYLNMLRTCLSKASDHDRRLILGLARKMATRVRSASSGQPRNHSAS